MMGEGPNIPPSSKCCDDFSIQWVLYWLRDILHAKTLYIFQALTIIRCTCTLSYINFSGLQSGSEKPGVVEE
ncbi:hypothetical protein [Thermococcus henrietii]|uniref:hypothetical protein n=1 Tax=Thermococcus henrietii TaxID=2016361 RepID=UPI001314B397|nr:hypothetical protein [Thermococcus henrietii]